MNNLLTFNAEHPLLFTSFHFWIFLVFVLAGFTLLQKRIAARNAFLCLVSLFFYYKTSGLFVLILIFTTIFNFYQARLIHHSSSEKRRRTHLWIGLAINLFFLCYFKYAYFFTDILNNLLGTHFRIFDAFAWIGNKLAGSNRFDAANILLPVGISFYTFQNISYLMDIFRKRIAPVKELLNFGFYVTFFPQLVAGPIVRAGEFVPQLYKPYHLGRKQFGLAVFWILNGLAKKIILSDYIAVNFVDRVFDNPTLFSGFENLAALFGYSLQVYADFSGYTDIAIGVAMLLGFYLPKNFRSPYKATNPGDFWRRWHISLSNWLKDYLYIPLGGNRNATFATYSMIAAIAAVAIILSGSAIVALILLLTAILVAILAHLRPQMRKTINTNLNLMNTMLLGGLWHGASWNFVIWGGLNGLGILVYKWWKNWSEPRRMLLLTALAALALALSLTFGAPAFRIAAVWLSILFSGNAIRFALSRFKKKRRIADKSIAPTWLSILFSGNAIRFAFNRFKEKQRIADKSIAPTWLSILFSGNAIRFAFNRFKKKRRIADKSIAPTCLSILFSGNAIRFAFSRFKEKRRIADKSIAPTCLSILFSGNAIRFALSRFKGKRRIADKTFFRSLGTAWAVAQTFVFISFTRLFFRSGSNLDPSEANQTAWNTAQNMVARIGGSWSGSPIGAMLYEYRATFALIILGMIIHWLPENLKRRYRLLFARLPLPAMAAFTAATIFILYQFVTADLQKFIYFQF